MKGDFTRRTFRPSNHFRRVLLQQGRLLLDSDWTEQVAIDVHRDATTTRDVVGRVGAPLADAGFRVGTAVDLESIDFAGASDGWAVGGGGAVLHTADGGATWAVQALPAATKPALHAVHFPTALRGWTVGANATILATSNGGAAWTPQAVPGGVPAATVFRGVRFADANRGFVVGAGATILRTTNGGTAWTAVAGPAGVTADLHAVARPSANVGCAVGASATILVTTNGGSSWTQKAAPAGVAADLHAAAFVSETAGWIVGDGATILATSDGGNTWQKQAPPAGVTAALRGVRFVNASVGFAVGDAGTILTTVDGGVTWVLQAPARGIGSSLRAIDAVGADVAFAAGADFVLLATTDGGTTWTQQTPPFDFTGGNELAVSAGRMYVDGILCENERALTLDAQPDQPALDFSTLTAGRYLVYLDVWERHLTALDRPQLREVALGGPDTTTRTRVVWQAKLEKVGAADVCTTFGDDWRPDPAPTGRLRARATPVPPPASVCLVPPNGGYRRLENQLYRVEIHTGGARGSAGAAGTALAVWSRENGSVTAELDAITTAGGATDSTLTLSQAGRDDVLGFAADEYLELSDEGRAQRGDPGVLVRITHVDGKLIRVTDWPANTPLTLADFPQNPIVRRWDGTADVTPGWTELEDGVEVEFGDGTYDVGDYWTIPARTLTATVEWDVAAGNPLFAPPEGIEHHFAPLALADRAADGSWTLVEDCRKLFPPLTALRHCFMVGGTGQETMPDPGGNPVALPYPLEVGVDNGILPLAGASVRFTILDGAGRLDGGAGPVTTQTDATGIARCTWSIDSTTQNQRVEAALVDDAGHVLDVPLHFTANLSRASDVRYTPGTCPNLAGDVTVQQALDKLARLTRLEKLQGDGQVVQQGQPLEKIVVRVANDCGSVTGGVVTFIVESGGGTLPNGTATEDVPLAGDEATVAWSPGTGTGTQVLLATLKQADAGGTALPIPAPAPEVRFTATIAAGGGTAPGVHVRSVRLANQALQNDTTVAAGSLANQSSGLQIVCDKALTTAIAGKPILSVTVALPYPLAPDDVKFWNNIDVFGFQPLELAGRVDVPTPQVIRWRPDKSTALWLQKELMPAVKARGIERVLVRVLVLGNFVWSREGKLFLDGEAFAEPANAPTIKWDPPSGDGRRGGNFVIWFWLK